MDQNLTQQIIHLKDPSHPLLKKMRQKAPGTYFHSLLVWEVASYACFNFKNSNPSLALVWAYFHDIWKMIHPYAYAENQEDWDYPFMPEIIRTHVEEWIKIAEAFNLPPEIIRFIKTHHWTAKAPAEDMNMAESYKLAERPISVEETLVMLADSCEAAIRWFTWVYTKANIRNIVQKVFLDKEEKDQLWSSVMIAADFKQVEDDFVDWFYYVYHRRFATENK